MAEVMHILLKYSDSYYNVDTIKEHRTILADKGAVIWGLIKPDRNSPGMAPAKQGQIREQLRRGIPTYAYLATHGAIMHKARITNLYTTEEVENREELIPPYYHKDLNRCVSGFEFSSI